jgi:hypothetical protein
VLVSAGLVFGALAAPLVLVGGEASAAGRGGGANGGHAGFARPGFATHHGVRGGEGRRFGHGVRNRGFANGYGYGYGGWGDVYGGGTIVPLGDAGPQPLPVGLGDPAVCCGPRLPIATGIQAAPTLPPTTYVIGESQAGSRRGTMHRHAVRTGPLVADSAMAGEPSLADTSIPRVIRVR